MGHKSASGPSTRIRCGGSYSVPCQGSNDSLSWHGWGVVMGLGGVSGPTMAVGVAPPPAPGFYSSPSTMTSFSSPSKEMAVSSAAPALAMFCRSSIGVPDLPYKLDGPATDTLRTLWSLELGRRWESIPPLRAGAWGPSAAEHPLMPWSFMYLRPRRFSDKADYAPILDSTRLETF